MKYLIFLISLTGLLTVRGRLEAQKLYSTNTAEISFYAGTPLEDIRAINDEAESKMLQQNGQIIFSALIQAFVFKNALMQQHFNEDYMESTHYPRADFKGYVTNISSVNFSKDGTYPVTLSGQLQIHGVTRQVQAEGALQVKGQQVSLNGSFKIKLVDYHVEGEYIGTKIAPEVAITVHCQYE